MDTPSLICDLRTEAMSSDSCWYNGRPLDPQPSVAGTGYYRSWSQKLAGTVEAEVMCAVDTMPIPISLSKYYL